MGRINVVVGDLGDVEQTTDTADVDKGTVGLQATHRTQHHFAHL